MSYVPTDGVASSVGEHEMEFKITVKNLNYLFWTVPFKVEVLCDFVNDSSCNHEYLPALDPSDSRIEVCEDDNPTITLDFGSKA